MTLKKDHLFLLDENIDAAIKTLLQQKGCFCKRVKPGSSDDKLFEEINSFSAILITHDKDFSNTELYKPSPSSGIIVIRIHPPTYENVSHAFDRLLNIMEIQDMYGKIIQIFSKGLEIIHDESV